MPKVNVIPDRDYQQVLRQRRKNARMSRKQERSNNVNSEKKREGDRQDGQRDRSRRE